MRDDTILRALLDARDQRTPCALVTLAAATGSTPRAAGAKMIIYADGRTVGTIGGGKFESLVIAEAGLALRNKTPTLKTYPLHEEDACSFGAICGGEVTVLIEPHVPGESITLIGAGHCSQAIATLAKQCGFHVTVIDDRSELLNGFPAHQLIVDQTPPAFITNKSWASDNALIIVSRNFEIDRGALHAALQKEPIGYIGMIGSQRKVRRVFDDLRKEGVTEDQLSRVYAPIGLDIGSDSPAEIAVSVIAETLQVLRKRGGGHLRLDPLNKSE